MAKVGGDGSSGDLRKGVFFFRRGNVESSIYFPYLLIFSLSLCLKESGPDVITVLPSVLQASNWMVYDTIITTSLPHHAGVVMGKHGA